jgi:cell division protein FtsN
MRGRAAIALIVPAFVAIFGVAIGAGFLMGQTSFRRSSPASEPTIPSISSPGQATPSGPGPQPPLTPATAPPSPADQPGGGEAPQGAPPSPEVSPAPPASPSVDVQQVPPPSAPQVVTPSVPGPTVSPPIPEPPSRFHIQAGAFGDRDSAVSLVKQLRDRGYAVTLVEGPPYRVWVGGYLDRATAERLAANLQAAGFDATLTTP